jgi:hypothetical protein
VTPQRTKKNQVAKDQKNTLDKADRPTHTLDDDNDDDVVVVGTLSPPPLKA